MKMECVKDQGTTHGTNEMKQQTLAVNGFEAYRKTTRKTGFLLRMDKLIPWPEFCAVIEPFYPKTGNGRPPVGLERMLRMYFIANGFNPMRHAKTRCMTPSHSVNSAGSTSGVSGCPMRRR